jgi:3'(2'), 5'-bisphosphate nucleotidase
MEGDTAAAQCILEEAGGSVTDLEGNRIRYNKHVLLNSGFVARAHSWVSDTPFAQLMRLV